MNRRGHALLDVLVAFNLLALVGSGCCALVLEANAALERAERQEREMEIATRLMTETALLSRTALGQRLGVHQRRGMLVEIQRPRPTLYRVSIGAHASPEHELLVSVLYRP